MLVARKGQIAWFKTMGYRDREAGLRIAPIFETPGANAAEQYNLEYRAADASANPYLMLAVLVQAGLDGIRQRLPAPQATEGDPTTLSPKELQDRGLVRLPQSLVRSMRSRSGRSRTRPPRISWY